MLQAPTSDRKTKSEASSKTAEYLPEYEPSSQSIGGIGRSRQSQPLQQRENLANLQKAYGNQAVLRMKGRSPAANPLQGGVLQRKCACGNTAGSSGSCAECQNKQKGILQTKLQIGEAGDRYEQEADYIADQIMRMPDPSLPQQVNSEDKVIQRKAAPKPTTLNSDLSSSEVPPIVHQVLNSPGQPLYPEARTFMESRFNRDFSQLRIHTDSMAAESAQEVNALAYTVGNNIVFGADQFSPNTRRGQQLLAHELVHAMQQEQGIRRNVIQRYPACSSAQDITVSDDHARARTMLSNAIAAVSSYNGTSPTKVFNALSTHFHGATSNAFSAWINLNLRFLWGMTWMAGYECYTGGFLEKTWACGSGELATTLWCVPLANIRLCPSYFGRTPTERSTTLIHEWVHKYGCNFDLGYEHENDYSQNSTFTQLLNADSFSSFVRDVQ
jgi:hypothetical protein